MYYPANEFSDYMSNFARSCFEILLNLLVNLSITQRSLMRQVSAYDDNDMRRSRSLERLPRVKSVKPFFYCTKIPQN